MQDLGCGLLTSMEKVGFLLLVVLLTCAKTSSHDKLRRQADEQVLCYTSDESCGGGESFPAQTVRDCCLGDGRSYNNINAVCQACIVIGWLVPDARFQAPEVGMNYELDVGLMKPQSIEDSYQLVADASDITANETTDFFINNVAITIGPDSTSSSVQLTLVVDGVSLEGLETAEITLSQRLGGPVLPENVILYPDVLLLVIEDINVPLVFFSEIDYRLDGEDGGEMDVVVVVRGVIQSSLTFRVTPRDIVDVLGRKEELALSEEFCEVAPEDNPDRPPYATIGEDFGADSTDIVVNPGDEGDHIVTIPITADSINEAAQSFAVEVSLVRNTSGAVDLDNRKFAVCTIVDDDPIIVSWEQPHYTFSENNIGLDDSAVRLIKDLNLTSEQTLFSFISPTGSVDNQDTSMATNDVDYFFGPTRGIARNIFSTQDGIDIFIITFPDNVYEGEEVFSLGITNSRGGVVFRIGEYPITTVHIFDDVVIGFNETLITLGEGDGSTEVCIELMSPFITEIQYPITLEVVTTEVTAGSSDYIEILPSENPLEDFLTETDTTSQCFTVQVREDVIVEGLEEFNLTLSISGNDSILLNSVTVSPDVLVIQIVDNDESDVVLVNDTVTGDPLLSVPLTIAGDTPSDPLLTETPSLCYEVHGRSDAYFNLISDMCTSVNAFYAAIGPFNVVHKIAVRAVDLAGDCRDILVETSNEANCTLSVDGVSVDVFAAAGVSVRRYSERVRISVPNCGGGRMLVMWVFCEDAKLQVYGENADGMVYSGRMINFVVARGINLQPTSHGIIGQFWNVPITADRLTGTTLTGESAEDYFKISVSHPDSPTRNFPGFLWPITWDNREGPCLYAGNNNGGSTQIIEGLTDTVLEGLYSDYITEDAFSTDFEFSRFSDDFCN